MEAVVRDFDGTPWVEAPGHDPGALSKLLINPENSESLQFDFRISLYRQKAKVQEHTHERAEHVYYIMSGRGFMTLGSETRIVKACDTIFIAPGVKHSIGNNGIEDLVFVVATSPPGELPLPDVR